MEDRVGHFLNYLSVEKGASGNTIAAYRNDLQQFGTYVSSIDINGDHPPLEAVNKEVIHDYVLELRRRNYADATVARKVAALKTFFGFLSEEGAVKRNPAESLTSPRVGKSLPKPLSLQEIDELLEQPARRDSPEAKRDRAMLELLYATGMRVTELVSLDVDTVDLDREPVAEPGRVAPAVVLRIHDLGAGQPAVGRHAVAVQGVVDPGQGQPGEDHALDQRDEQEDAAGQDPADAHLVSPDAGQSDPAWRRWQGRVLHVY